MTGHGAIGPAHAAFLAEPRSAIAATIDERGQPSQSVVWFVHEDDSVWLSTRPTSAKVRHLRRDPRLSLLVIAADGGSYVRLEGRAGIDETVDAAARRRLIARYVGEDQADGWLAGHVLPSPNTLVRLRPDRVVGYGLG